MKKNAAALQVRRLVILGSLAVLIFLAGLDDHLVETVYSDHLYLYISLIQRTVSAVFPFALGDFAYAFLVLFCCWSAYRLVQKPVRNTAPLALVNFVLAIYLVFKVLWGLNYSRPSISARLGITDRKYKTEELVELGKFLITRVNQLDTAAGRKPQPAYPVDALKDGAYTALNRLAKINPFFTYKQASVKPVLFEWLTTKIGIEGYYCPLTGEANINMRLPAMELPFVTCHEISHQLGIAREDEANLIGYLVSINSSDPYFRYSGYYSILRSVLFEIRIKSPADFSALMKTISPGTRADFRKEQEFWEKYNGDMSAYMNTALDRFLKANNQKKGTDSYQDIVLWVYNLRRAGTSALLPENNGQ